MIKQLGYKQKFLKISLLPTRILFYFAIFVVSKVCWIFKNFGIYTKRKPKNTLYLPPTPGALASVNSGNVFLRQSGDHPEEDVEKMGYHLKEDLAKSGYEFMMY